jgi:hypothetical protein
MHCSVGQTSARLTIACFICRMAPSSAEEQLERWIVHDARMILDPARALLRRITTICCKNKSSTLSSVWCHHLFLLDGLRAGSLAIVLTRHWCTLQTPLTKDGEKKMSRWRSLWMTLMLWIRFPLHSWCSEHEQTPWHLLQSRQARACQCVLFVHSSSLTWTSTSGRRGTFDSCVVPLLSDQLSPSIKR